MTISSNRLIELAITSDPTSALLGTTWSFSAGDLFSVVHAQLNAEQTGTVNVMQPGDTIDLDGNNLASVTFGSDFQTSPNTAGENFDDASSYELVCFVQGTLIITDHEDCPVEKLNVGDRVFTQDHGFQEIRWIGSRRVMARARFAPIVFLPGSIGNARQLRLSRQHRILVEGAAVEFHPHWLRRILW